VACLGPNRPSMSSCNGAPVDVRRLPSVGAVMSVAKCACRRAGWHNSQVSELLSQLANTTTRDEMLGVLRENFANIP
jgi:hypothetical protein